MDFNNHARSRRVGWIATAAYVAIVAVIVGAVAFGAVQVFAGIATTLGDVMAIRNGG